MSRRLRTGQGIRLGHVGLALGLLGLAATARAQGVSPTAAKTPQETLDASCEDSRTIPLRQGQALRNNCSSLVLVLTRKAAEASAGSDEIAKGLLVANQALAANLDGQVAKLEEMVQSHKAVEATMEKYYQELKQKTDELSKLTEASTKLTDQALALNKAQRIASYVSGTLLGGTAGGLVGGKIADSNTSISFSWAGAGVGAAGGLALTLIVDRIITGAWF